MIYSCSETQKNQLIAYIGNEYPKCLYLYIDMQKYGCSSEMTRTWIDLSNGRIRAVLLTYHSALHIYSKCLDFDMEEIVNFIIDKQPSIICASSELIKQIAPVLINYGFKSEFGHVGKYRLSHHFKPSYDVLRANQEDIKQIAQLLYDDDDIGASYTIDDLVRQMEERLNDNYVRSYVIKEDELVIAHLGTGAEINNLCTICYVITHPEYRGKGLSSALFAHACKELDSEGKEIFSVYYPENSRKLHNKMGFVDFCEIGKLYRILE